MIIFWQSLRLFAFMTLLTGILYPLLITCFAYIVFNDKANGSLVVSKGHIIGSTLIGQKFEDPKHFWSRPSAVDYNPLPSGGSNLGPISSILKKKVEERKQFLLKTHELPDNSEVPPGLLYASGSGLDPHIRISTAYFQIVRVAKARGLSTEAEKEKLKNLIDTLSEHHYVNVLLLNKSLNNSFPNTGQSL